MGWLNENAPTSPVECDFCRRRTNNSYKGKKDAKNEARAWFEGRSTNGRTSCPLCSCDREISEAIQSAALTHDKAVIIVQEF